MIQIMRFKLLKPKHKDEQVLSIFLTQSRKLFLIKNQEKLTRDEAKRRDLTHSRLGTGRLKNPRTENGSKTHEVQDYGRRGLEMLREIALYLALKRGMTPAYREQHR